MKSCATCRYARNRKAVPAPGPGGEFVTIECHAEPPQHLSQLGFDLTGYWPRVSISEWCGRHTE